MIDEEVKWNTGPALPGGVTLCESDGSYQPVISPGYGGLTGHIAHQAANEKYLTSSCADSSV